MEKIDWSRLFHAYGMAADTPGHLRALVSEDEAATRDAVAHLEGAVIHQGTPWTVTPPAALVVAGLLGDPRTVRSVAEPFAVGEEPAARPLRAILLDFLAEVAEAAQPDVPEEELRAAAYPHGRERDIADLAARMFAGGEEDEDDEDGNDEGDWDEEVADAAIAQAMLELRVIAPALIGPVSARLGDDDPRVRSSAAEALAAITEITSPVVDSAGSS
ncbi:hypothetical protein [Planomonospora sphaerica]|uniref:hypothetical protein n=1 Tax=Planomonospora sphaerica TaxID=161355 RepID=UPI00083B28A4|nr:hypothetical protein [Planomonospora sphaerica]